MTSTTLDLEAYFQRIGYQGSREPSLEALQGISAAHVQSIPFENLDVLLGKRILLDEASVQRKLIHERRGGYCFEQNGLFLLVLEALGFEAKPLSARVRYGREPGVTPARTHLFVRVEIDGHTWLADVGIGGLSLSAPIRFVLDAEQHTPHESRRILRQGNVYVHQALLKDEWTDVYEFTGEEMPAIDREVGNWYTSGHPDSHFRKRILVARAASEGGRITLLDNEFSIRAKDGNAEKRTIESTAELYDILERYFGLSVPTGLQLPAITT